jgi:formate dehydrogenase subunit gamma
LEILHAVQNELGHVPPESVPLIAEALNLSRAEVHGVISFYHHFRAAPAGRCVVQVCRAEACKALNGDDVADAARQRLGIDFGETRADGSATLEAVYCLGNCACAPSVVIDGRLHGRCAPREIGRLIDAAVAG